MLCECGCGQDAGVYHQTNLAIGMVRGQPKKFIRFHKKKATHCKRGHELVSGNILKSGKCKTCDYARKKNKKHRDVWRSQGLCTLCGKRKPDEGFVTCSKCRKENYARHCEYKKNNKKATNEWSKKRRRKERLDVLTHYSQGAPRCACCGERTVQFLCIDHINGGGNSHRKQGIGSIYPWLLVHDFPEGFQVLCHNCNSAKSYYGICPHQQQTDNQLKEVK